MLLQFFVACPVQKRAAVRSLGFALWAGVLVIVSMEAASSYASIVGFNNRASWLAAAAPISVTENFQSFAVDTSFRNNVFVSLAGGMTLGEIGPVSQSDANYIDVSPFGFNESVN